MKYFLSRKYLPLMIFTDFFFLCHIGSQFPKTAGAASQCQEDGQTEHGEDRQMGLQPAPNPSHRCASAMWDKKDNPKQTKLNLAAFPALGLWVSGSVSQVRAAIPVDVATDSGSGSSLALHMPRFLFCGAEIPLNLGWGDVLVASLLL